MKYLILQPWISYRGAESMSVGLAKELTKKGEDVCVAGLYLDKQDRNGVNFSLPPEFIQKIFKSYNLFLYIFGVPYLIYLILKNIKGVDILVPYNLPTSWLSAIFGKIFKKQVVWMSQGIPEKDGSLLWSIASSNIDIYLTKLIDKIIVPSNYLAKKIKLRYKKDAIVIQNPITKIGGSLKDLPKEVIKLRKDNKFVFLLVGALNKQKRQIEMLNVFKRILKIEAKCLLIFVGEGPELENLKHKINNLKLNNNVYVAGYVPKNKIGAYYQICDLNLLPSTKETFGATPLEALTFGKNSLITNDSGISEIISKFAIVSHTSEEEILKNLISYIKNKEYIDSKVNKYKNKIIKTLNWKDYVNRFIKESEIDPIDTYDKKYYQSHYHNASNDLLNERETRVNRALDYLNPKKDEKILDLGVGEGYLASKIIEFGSIVWGVDYSKDAISLAKKKFGTKIKLFVMDAQKLDFPDNYFDKIVCIDVFEHVYQNKLDRVLLEISRVIKPNGLLVIETSPNSFFWKPIMFIGKILFNIQNLESEKYHINIFNYFRLRNMLFKISPNVKIELHNDGKNFLSSRVLGTGAKINKGFTYKILRLYDLLMENKFFERNIFLGHDLWAVVHVVKKR